MDLQEPKEVPLSSLEHLLIPTKKPVNVTAITNARDLVLRREKLPAIFVAKDIGSERFLVAFGHNLLAGALLALDQDQALADQVVHISEMLTLRHGESVLSRTELSMKLFDKASESGYLNHMEQVNWGLFKSTVRKILRDSARRQAAAADAPVPGIGGGEDAMAGMLSGGGFVEGNSETINLALVRRLARMREQRTGMQEPTAE